MVDSTALSLHRLAELDLEAFEILAPKDKLSSIAGFHAQQAVEKAFKAVLDIREIGYPKTHNLLMLLDLLKASGSVCVVDERTLVVLIRCSVEGRYSEKALSEVKIEPISQALQIVFDWARKELKIN